MPLDSIWDWNPWWDDPARIEQLAGRPREETKEISVSLDDSKVTILSGVRRAGKTTLMYQLIDHLLMGGIRPQNILFLGLEDPAFTTEGLGELLSEYRKEHAPSGRTYLFLDEVQAKTGWERILRKELDVRKEAKHVVSGSSSALLAGEYATLLTGRNLTYIIRPVSFAGFGHFGGEPPSAALSARQKGESSVARFRRYLEIGGFPEVILQKDVLRKATLAQYFSDIVHRDVVHLRGADPVKVQSLAGYLLTTVGTTFSLSSLRKALGLSFDAIRDYLCYLEDAGLFHIVREFSFSPKTAPKDAGRMKSYCVDTGLANAARRRGMEAYGRLAENAVCIELVRRGLSPGFFRGQKEVDFVYPQDSGGVQLINVCMASDIPPREFAGLEEFSRRFPGPRTARMILTEDIEKQTGGIKLVPIWKWLSAGSGRNGV